MLNRKKLLGFILSIIMVSSFADGPAVVESVNKTTGVIKPPVNSSALSQADQDYNQLNAAKRKAMIAQEQAKLNPSVVKPQSGGGSRSSLASETMATSIVIHEHGNSFATLLFSDGSSLVVSVGDKIGRYTVNDITLNGVTIGVCGKKCTNVGTIRRVYPMAPMQKGTSSQQVQTQSTDVYSRPKSSGNSDNPSVPSIQSTGAQ